MWFADTSTGQETPSSKTARFVWVHAWSPDSKWFLTVGPGLLSLWDSDTGLLVGERKYGNGIVVVPTFSADGEQVHVYDRFGEP